ncbi:hypothetical protein GMMP13_970005 [Candidatus Magnetomoraceae bacterium gMMP-13]
MENPPDILIVEDSPTQSLHLQDILEKNNYKVIIARNGLQAFEYLKKKLPMLVISDIIMPKMNGYELCSLIKDDERFKNIPVILLTSLSNPEDVVKALECGADNFVTKPYKEKFLISRIQNVLLNQEFRNSCRTEMGIEIFFAGKKHFITSNRMQIIDLLFSTYESAILKNRELEKVNCELMLAQRELEQKNIEMADLNREKNHFLGMAAHDLRNPLSAIFNYGDLLLDESELLSNEQKEIISKIKSSSEFMLQLVNEFLDISIIESGRLTLDLQETHLASLIKESISFNCIFAVKKGIRLVFNYSDTENIPSIILDVSKIKQVINNLISNALKFSYPQGCVEISLKKIKNQVVISVKDEGQGIPKGEMTKLFSPFEKTTVRSTAGEKSTGLGLAIAKKIIQEHNGEIRAKSKPGHGSIFYVSLPFHPNKVEAKTKTKVSCFERPLYSEKKK